MPIKPNALVAFEIFYVWAHDLNWPNQIKEKDIFHFSGQSLPASTPRHHQETIFYLLAAPLPPQESSLKDGANVENSRIKREINEGLYWHKQATADLYHLAPLPLDFWLCKITTNLLAWAGVFVLESNTILSHITGYFWHWILARKNKLQSKWCIWKQIKNTLALEPCKEIFLLPTDSDLKTDVGQIITNLSGLQS